MYLGDAFQARVHEGCWATVASQIVSYIKKLYVCIMAQVIESGKTRNDGNGNRNGNGNDPFQKLISRAFPRLH